jgi:hypothetical protein
MSFVFVIRHIFEIKWKCNKTVHRQFAKFQEACVSVRREVLYNILIDCGLPVVVVCVGKHLTPLRLISVATRYKVWVCGRWLPGTAGSDPARLMNVFLF